jgi:1,4-alpha-glucan branching enzyme
MYTHMSKFDSDHVIDRGIALHKMIRMITMSLGGEGYLNFMGNEFGHPEWIDFPREGNNWSYFYCRRQWHLADDDTLRYSYLNDFDEAIVSLTKERKLFRKKTKCLFIGNDDKVINFERGGLVFAFNFHPTNSYEGYWITVPKAGKYRAVFSTDEKEFGGYDRISKEYVYTAEKHPDKKAKFQIYLPSRTAICLEKVKE